MARPSTSPSRHVDGYRGDYLTSNVTEGRKIGFLPLMFAFTM